MICGEGFVEFFGQDSLVGENLPELFAEGDQVGLHLGCVRDGDRVGRRSHSQILSQRAGNLDELVRSQASREDARKEENEAREDGVPEADDAPPFLFFKLKTWTYYIK